MGAWITIDGSQGEGGGQILRTALALSLVTGKAFRLENIRAGREKPGLLRQHLTAVHAAVTVGRARAAGAELGSRDISFEPSTPLGGDYRFAVGTAGSVTLVLQAVLPALLVAGAPSTLTLEGGTHNPQAPPFDFLAKTFLPVLRRMGVSIDVVLDRYGFYPAGGGRFTVTVQPCAKLARIALLERGPVKVHARALVSSLPENIATRELAVVRERMGLERACCRLERIARAIGPGNVVLIVMQSGAVTEVVTGFGEKGVSAEQVAARACDEAAEYLAADVPVGLHLADQLLVPMALAGGGTFCTLRPTLHTTTNVQVIRHFLDVPLSISAEREGTYRMTIG